MLGNYLNYIYNEKISVPPGEERDILQKNAPLGHKIKQLIKEKQPQGAKIYYHIDLDGVASALAMKWFLKKQGINNFIFEAIQYGGREYAISKTPQGWLAVLVDFAHGKPFIDLHTDHHDSQVGAAGLTGFVHASSNAEDISALDPSADAFSPTDLKVINMTDTAGYGEKFTPEEVRQFLFKFNSVKSLEDNKILFGMTVNKLLLGIKNKQINFIPYGAVNKILQITKYPSLMSLNSAMKQVIAQAKLPSAQELQKRGEDYVKEAKRLSKEGTIEDIPNLKIGESMLIGNIIVQYGANQKMMKGGFDRYTPFEVYPDANYICLVWPMGIVQISKNPFKKGGNPYDLGEFLLGENGILSKYKEELQSTKISLSRIKSISELDIKKIKSDITKKSAIGFTWKDFINLFNANQIRGVDITKENGWLNTIKSISNKKFDDLSDKQIDILRRISVSAWDFLQANSGGHKDISQISGLNYLPESFRNGGSIPFMKELQQDIVEKMQGKELSHEEL